MLKIKAETASLKCITDMNVMELKSHTQSPFLPKYVRLFFRSLKDKYGILIFNTIFPIRNMSKYVNLKGLRTLIYRGMTLQHKRAKVVRENFAFRAKMGEYEIEINGNREEVLKTIEDLPSLMSSVHKAFERAKPRKVTTLTVKTEAPKEEKAPSQKYPRILPTEDYDQAILKILETDWGKWRPRTLDELKEALKANGMGCPGRTLAAVLMRLVKKEKIRRWKIDAGNVYILAEKEALGFRGKANEQN